MYRFVLTSLFAWAAVSQSLPKLVKVGTLIDEDGFYNRASAAMTPDLKHFIVLDQGNKRVVIFDQDLKKIRDFGKEGNGPGEFGMVFGINAFNDRIFVNGMQRLQIFTLAGKHIKDISEQEFGFGHFVFDPKTETLRKQLSENEILEVIYDKNGNMIKKISNPEFGKQKDENRDPVRFRFIRSTDIPTPFGDKWLKAAKGAYKLNILNSDKQKVDEFTRSFSRIKRDFSKFKLSIGGDMPEKKRKEMEAKMRLQMMQQMGEYKDDIESIAGVYNERIFLQVASPDDECRIDVISSDFKYLGTLTIAVEDFQRIRMYEDRVLIIQRNEEDGPFVEVYKVEI